MSQWAAWHACTKPCGTGHMVRVRNLLYPTDPKVVESLDFVETLTCNDNPCDKNCLLSPWTAWSRCDAMCGYRGQRHRTREVLSPAESKGTCGDLLQEEQPCNRVACPVDCEVSEWSQWACNKPCGGGVAFRSSTITRMARNGAEPCPEEHQTQSCAENPCVPPVCVYSNWQQVGECSKSCNGGKVVMSRYSLAPASMGCIDTRKTAACNTIPCGCEGKVPLMSPWGKCSTTCNDGIQNRTKLSFSEKYLAIGDTIIVAGNIATVTHALTKITRLARHHKTRKTGTNATADGLHGETDGTDASHSGNDYRRHVGSTSADNEKMDPSPSGESRKSGRTIGSAAGGVDDEKEANVSKTSAGYQDFWGLLDFIGVDQEYARKLPAEEAGTTTPHDTLKKKKETRKSELPVLLPAPTKLDLCAIVVCDALDQCHGVGTCDPETGKCSNPAAPAGTTCDDNNERTTNDVCTNGECVGEDKCKDVICVAPDACHGIGVCNAETGVCSRAPKKETGTPCDDGIAATTNDSCDEYGVCVGEDPCAAIVCKKLSQCHDFGVCHEGKCGNPLLMDGTVCDDGDSSTVDDKCLNGICASTDLCKSVVCVAKSECHEVGVCEAGACNDPLKADGTPCDDHLSNTQNDKCSHGVCGGANVCEYTTCMALDSCYLVGKCDPKTGKCSNPMAPNGTKCDDGIATTHGDACFGGVCRGIDQCATMTCPPADQCHKSGAKCDPKTQKCSNPIKKDGTACDDGRADTVDDKCVRGVCVGSDKCLDVTCVPTICRSSGVCDPFTGKCSFTFKPENSVCDDGDPTTHADRCIMGKCGGEELCAHVVCTQQDACHQNGVCDPRTGLCSNPLVPNGTLCDDQNPLTVRDICVAGTCVGASLCANVKCVEIGVCYEEGICDPHTGKCHEQPKVDGASCDDGNPDTLEDSCQKGICSGSTKCTAVSCTALDQCHDVGVCNPLNGLCSNPAKPEGRPCDDGLVNTVKDRCTTQGGEKDGRMVLCQGVDFCAKVVCKALDSCHVKGECDHQTGKCSNPKALDNTACESGNEDTWGDQCRDGVCVSGESCSEFEEPTEQSCPDTLVCPVDAQASAWSEWGVCSVPCGIGQQWRQRFIAAPAQFGGKEISNTLDVRNCTMSPCRTDCVWSEWSKWTVCPPGCGIPKERTRTRGMKVPEADGGQSCSGDAVQVDWCPTKPCRTECRLSKWTAWSTCTHPCQEGRRMRSRTHLSAGVVGGDTCKPEEAANLIETEDCAVHDACPTMCKLSEWSSWSTCEGLCDDNGVMSRTRSVETKGQHPFPACPDANALAGIYSQIMTCRPISCDNFSNSGCVLSEWQEWTPCLPQSCNPQQVRHRRVVFPDDTCTRDAQLLEQRECEGWQCAVIDCDVMGQWAVWGACSHDCGGGTRTRVRDTLWHIDCGPGEQIETCAEKPCCPVGHTPFNGGVAAGDKFPIHCYRANIIPMSFADAESECASTGTLASVTTAEMHYFFLRALGLDEDYWDNRPSIITDFDTEGFCFSIATGECTSGITEYDCLRVHHGSFNQTQCPSDATVHCPPSDLSNVLLDTYSHRLGCVQIAQLPAGLSDPFDEARRRCATSTQTGTARLLSMHADSANMEFATLCQHAVGKNKHSKDALCAFGLQATQNTADGTLNMTWVDEPNPLELHVYDYDTAAPVVLPPLGALDPLCALIGPNGMWHFAGCSALAEVALVFACERTYPNPAPLKPFPVRALKREKEKVVMEQLACAYRSLNNIDALRDSCEAKKQSVCVAPVTETTQGFCYLASNACPTCLPTTARRPTRGTGSLRTAPPVASSMTTNQTVSVRTRRYGIEHKSEKAQKRRDD
eukprot:GEMP01000534.1.p1 GENE.GEMP01000534.1~~GEMP01000534.1.p1  ORF type:complete len:1837 (+),score=426.05 GEMP01000534.1:592-6102(+)